MRKMKELLSELDDVWLLTTPLGSCKFSCEGCGLKPCGQCVADSDTTMGHPCAVGGWRGHRPSFTDSACTSQCSGRCFLGTPQQLKHCQTFTLPKKLNVLLNLVLPYYENQHPNKAWSPKVLPVFVEVAHLQWWQGNVRVSKGMPL